MSETVIGTLINAGAVHQLVRTEDGRDEMHTYVRSSDMDRPLTTEETREWVMTVRRCGGTIWHEPANWAQKLDTTED